MDVEQILQRLATRRPIFHSEADFQHALAWELHQVVPDAQIRLELPIVRAGKALHVDIWVTHHRRTIPIELKYKSRKLTATVNEESFMLLDHSAQDAGRYDFIKDIYRLEQLVSAESSSIGYAIFLTNDASYWNAGAKDAAVDAQFRLHEGTILSGSRMWSAHASAGTTRNRELPINLAGTYPLHWHTYAALDVPAHGLFRYLLITVPGQRV